MKPFGQINVEIGDNLRLCWVITMVNPTSPEEGELVELKGTDIIYKEIKKKALFHTWLKVQDLSLPAPSETAIALVEYEDGSMDTANFDQIRFVDRSDEFSNRVWFDIVNEKQIRKERASQNKDQKEDKNG